MAESFALLSFLLLTSLLIGCLSIPMTTMEAEVCVSRF